MKLSNSAIIIFIMLVAAVLRFYNFFEVPFTHDEFSALFRTEFNSFSELIEKGVKTDTHPPGIQVFLYYWVQLFGSTQWVVKLPFVIFGLLSILLIYKIAQEWFNETVGLLSAAFLASIQYTVSFSLIARPYISGLFFSLLMVYFWSLLMRKPEKHFYRNLAGFILSAALCAYNHHFSLLFAAIVGLSGLFFIERRFLLHYAVSGIIIFILYIPNLNIFLDQLEMGGVEAWLGKPKNDFIFHYISYIFNHSYFTMALVLAIVIYGLLTTDFRKFSSKQLILFSIWFLLPFLIGFFYSRYVNAVLQYSVLIFSFPFFFFILFGHLKMQRRLTNGILVVLILAVNIYSLIHLRKHYTLFFQSPYKSILLDHQEITSSHNDVLSIINSHKGITEYYIQKLNIDTNFVRIDSFEVEKDLIRFLEQEKDAHNFLYFGGVSSSKPWTVPIIREFYPTLEQQKNYPAGTTYLFSKKPVESHNLISLHSFETEKGEGWSPIDQSKVVDTLSFSGNRSYLMHSSAEYSPSFTIPLDSIITHRNNFIDVSVKAYLQEGAEDIILVTTLDSEEKTFTGAEPDLKILYSIKISKMSG